MINTIQISEFRSLFFALSDTAHSIVITSHFGPDDDSIASVLSLYFILNEKYPDAKIRIAYTGDGDDRWSYFENFSRIEFVTDIADILDGVDLLIGLDADIYSRFSKMPEKLLSASCKKIAIDHHGNPPDSFDLLFVDSSISSNAEIIYTLFFSDRAAIPPRIAETLLLGILGDTGNFRFINPKQVSAFSVVSRLVEEGSIDIAFMESKYSAYREAVFVAMQELMKNTSFVTVPGWPRFLYSYISRDYLEKSSLPDVDISAAKNIFIATYGTRLTGIGWAIVAVPNSSGEVSVSMRSLKDSINVRLLAQGMGIGGGHDRAAGARFKPAASQPADSLPSIEKMMVWLKEHDPIY